MSVATEAGETDEDAKKRQKRGGKGVNIISFSLIFRFQGISSTITRDKIT